MIRVLHILGSAHFGGIERLVHDLVHVQKNNHDLRVGVLFCNACGEFLDQFMQLGIPVFSLNLNSGYDLSPIKAKRAYQIFSAQDILHFHSFIPLLSWVAKKSRCQIIYTEHGNFGFGRKRTLSDRVKEKLKRDFLNNAVAYISFNSRFTRDVAEARYGLNGIPRAVIYNGIALHRNVTREKDNSFELPAGLANKFIVGTSSRFAGVKRLDRLIRAFAEFQKGKENTSLLLVGDGILRTDLEKIVVELGVEGKTVFPGFQENVHYWQGAMDVCVFPSKYEAFGLVALETLSLGKPTLVFKDGGGLTEIVGGIAEEDIVDDESHLQRRLDYYYARRDSADFNEKRIEYVDRFCIDNMAAQFYEKYTSVLCAV